MKDIGEYFCAHCQKYCDYEIDQRIVCPNCDGILLEAEKVTRLTREQAIILTGYTGILACEFVDFHEDIERRLGRQVYISELGSVQLSEQIKELYKQDFFKILPLPEKVS